MKHTTITTNVVLIIVVLGISAGIFFRSIFRRLEPQISLKNAQLQAEFYRPGQPVRKGGLSADSSGVAAINLLLEKQRGRWRRSWTTYAPVVVVRSDDFNLNFHRNLLILNYRDKNNSGKYTQVVSKFTEEEFDHASKSILESLVESPLETGQK